MLRHPLIHNSPLLLLKYETFAQKEAYYHIETKGQPQKLELAEKRRLLIVIPFRDKWAMTETALASIEKQCIGNLEILVALVDNGSVEEATAKGIARWSGKSHAAVSYRALRYDMLFNFSKLNNLAVKECADFGAEFVLFLNNDVQILHPTALTEMCSFLVQHPRTGSVGCTLLYPDHSIQHLFIALGCKIVGAHPFKGMKYDPRNPWYVAPRPVGAATAAMLMMRINDFLTVGAFEERLPSCYQDVDLALKLQTLMKVNWVLPWITALHHETQTRDPIHSWDEVEYMDKSWGDLLTANPYFSTKISRWSERVVLTLGEGKYPWWLLRK
jgi:hypothetical protein